jgi:hypothetical protein
MKPTEQQIAEWKKVYDTLVAECEKDAEDTHEYWVENEGHFQSICVGWCMGQGMTLDEALDFYEEMIPLNIF